MVLRWIAMGSKPNTSGHSWKHGRSRLASSIWYFWSSLFIGIKIALMCPRRGGLLGVGDRGQKWKKEREKERKNVINW